MRVQAKTEVYTASTTIQPNNFGGFIASNRGTANGQVMGHVLAPGQVINLSPIAPSVIWDTPITVIAPSGAEIVITLLQYN